MLNDKTTIKLKSGKTVQRVIHTNKNGRKFIKYNGRYIGVAFYCGYWYEIYD